MAAGTGSGGSATHPHPHTHTAATTGGGSVRGINPVKIVVWVTVVLVAAIAIVGGILSHKGSSGGSPTGSSKDHSGDAAPGTVRRSVEQRTAPPQPAPSQPTVLRSTGRLIRLEKGVWSPFWDPGPKGGYISDWTTSDGTIEIRYRFGDGTVREFTGNNAVKKGPEHWPDLASDPLFQRNLHYEIQFCNKDGGGSVSVISYQ